MGNGKSDNPEKLPVFEPARLSDIIDLGIAITAHCRNCGHWARLDPANLTLQKTRTLPSLEGVFLCTICQSRNTCAMPEYIRPKPGGDCD